MYVRLKHLKVVNSIDYSNNRGASMRIKRKADRRFWIDRRNDVSEFESFGLITNRVVKSFKIMSINITNIRGYIGYDVIDIYILYANKRSENIDLLVDMRY